MTTVAFKDGVMASDSRVTEESCITTGQKLFRKKVGKKEFIVGVAGELFKAMVFVDWWGTESADKLKLLHTLTDDDFYALIWDGKKLLTCNYLCRPIEVDEDYFAIGSGGAHAMTAMDCGKTASQAVQLAIKRDSYSGGRVVTMSLETK